MKWQIWGMGEAVAEKFPLFPLSRPAPAQPTSMLFPLCQQYWKTQYLSDIIHEWIVVHLNCIWFFTQLVQTQLCWTPKTRKKTFPNKSRHWVLFTSSIPIFPQDVLVYFSFHTPKQLIDNVQRLFFLASSCFFSIPLAPNQLFAVWAFSAFSLSLFSHSLPLPPPAAGAQLSIGHSVGFGERLGGGCHLHFHQTRFDPKFS